MPASEININSILSISARESIDWAELRKESSKLLPVKFKRNYGIAGDENKGKNGKRRETCYRGGRNTHPSVVMVTMVYQNAEGMEVKVVSSTFFSA